MASPLSMDSYLEKRLRPLDAEHYSGAGVLPYRKVGDKIEVLLAWEKPWNSFTNEYDPYSWNTFGGKKIPRYERTADTTAVRSFGDTMEGIQGLPRNEEFYKKLWEGFVLWCGFGKFALLIVDVTGLLPEDIVDRFQKQREREGPTPEFKLTPTGVKRYVKQIKELEWVMGTELVPNAAKGTSDFLGNMLQIEALRKFLAGDLDPSSLPNMGDDSDVPPAMRPQGKAGKGGKDRKGGKGWGGGKSKGGFKGGKSWGGGNSWGMPPMMGGGKGMMMPPMPPIQKGGMMPMPMGPGMMMPMDAMGGGMGGGPMMPMPMQPQPNSLEQQQNMYGEQLYALVKNIAPSPFLAQQITGMLLELPHNELMMNLKSSEELHRRVAEAMDLLKEDGVIQ